LFFVVRKRNAATSPGASSTGTNQNVITAGAVHPIDFASHIFKLLGVYGDPTLEAWYGLYKTGDPAYFFKLAKNPQCAWGGAERA
jgi:hypothetical protein